jgi:hypothetical protein
MGELVKGKPPKGITYTKKLLNYSQPATFTDKIKHRFFNKKTQAHNISQWCRILDSSKNNNHTRKYLNYLKEKNALLEEYKEGEPPNQTTYYSLDKNQLLVALKESDWWNTHRDLVFQVVNQAEDGKKIVTDF